jgi:hypothetical protein
LNNRPPPFEVKLEWGWSLFVGTVMALIFVLKHMVKVLCYVSINCPHKLLVSKYKDLRVVVKWIY